MHGVVAAAARIPQVVYRELTHGSAISCSLRFHTLLVILLRKLLMLYLFPAVCTQSRKKDNSERTTATAIATHSRIVLAIDCVLISRCSSWKYCHLYAHVDRRPGNGLHSQAIFSSEVLTILLLMLDQ